MFLHIFIVNVILISFFPLFADDTKTNLPGIKVPNTHEGISNVFKGEFNKQKDIYFLIINNSTHGKTYEEAINVAKSLLIRVAPPHIKLIQGTNQEGKADFIIDVLDKSNSKSSYLDMPMRQTLTGTVFDSHTLLLGYNPELTVVRLFLDEIIFDSEAYEEPKERSDYFLRLCDRLIHQVLGSALSLMYSNSILNSNDRVYKETFRQFDQVQLEILAHRLTLEAYTRFEESLDRKERSVLEQVKVFKKMREASLQTWEKLEKKLEIHKASLPRNRVLSSKPISKFDPVIHSNKMTCHGALGE